jgi:hypothetical protein
MLKTKKKIRRKVAVVFGKWGKKTDFTIEPYVKGDEEQNEVIWIEECD